MVQEYFLYKVYIVDRIKLKMRCFEIQKIQILLYTNYLGCFERNLSGRSIMFRRAASIRPIIYCFSKTRVVVTKIVYAKFFDLPEERQYSNDVQSIFYIGTHYIYIYMH